MLSDVLSRWELKVNWRKTKMMRVARKSRQERWRVRMEEMSGERTTRKIFEGEIGGKRPRGRPRLRWTDNFK